MGACKSVNSDYSTKHKSKTSSNNLYNEHQMINNNVQGNIKRENAEPSIIYPRGSCILLRKIEGKSVSNDKLKSKLEIYARLFNIDHDSSFAIDFVIKEHNQSNLIASLHPQLSVAKEINYENYIEMEYFFERDQTLELIAVDMSTKSNYVFQVKVAKLASLISKPCILTNSVSGISIELKASPIKSEKTIYNFLVNITDPAGLPIQQNSPVIGKEAFYIFKNKNDGVTWRGVYKSEESSNLQFSSIKILEDDLFLGDKNMKFKVELHLRGYDQPYGTAIVSIEDLMSLDGLIELKSLSNSPVAGLKIQYTTSQKLDFTELLKNGLQISLMVGVDFTSSNGPPFDSRSLHFLGGTEPNEYERAIRSCGNILAYYDSDQSFPLFGFGGIPCGKGDVEHVFPLNYSNDPCVYGIDNMIETYKSALAKTQLYGPTYFSPILNNLYNFVRANSNGLSYYVLLLITDGIINDLQETVDSLVKCSELPISVIIIGVGNADFSTMDTLDGDNIPLQNSKGLFTQRDIVQFVPFKKFETNSSKLSEEVLKELPGQIELFYRNRDFLGKNVNH